MGFFVQLVKDGVVIGLLYALFAYGLSMILATTGIWHMAHGATFIVAAFTFWTLFDAAGLPWWVAGGGAIAAGALLGGGMEVLVYRPLRRLGAPGMVFLAASLALLTLIQSLMPLIWGSETKSVQPRPVMSLHIQLGPVALTTWDLLVIGCSAVVFALVYWFQTRTRLGLSFRALGDNPERAESLGIPLDRTYLWSFVIGSAIVAPTSILIAVHNPLVPGTGFELLLKAITALIVGGVGSMTGALFGGLLIGLVENLGAWRLPTEWAQFGLFALLFLFIVIRPQGLMKLWAKRT